MIVSSISLLKNSIKSGEWSPMNQWTQPMHDPSAEEQEREAKFQKRNSEARFLIAGFWKPLLNKKT